MNCHFTDYYRTCSKHLVLLQIRENYVKSRVVCNCQRKIQMWPQHFVDRYNDLDGSSISRFLETYDSRSDIKLVTSPLCLVLEMFQTIFGRIWLTYRLKRLKRKIYLHEEKQHMWDVLWFKIMLSVFASKSPWNNLLL